MSPAEKHLTELRHAYQTLNISHSATPIFIKQAYRRLLRRWHPDLYASGTSLHDEATQMTKLINEAYSAIRQAPLRYYSETLSRMPAGQPNYGSKIQLTAQTLEPLNTARIEFWVRFACGATLGFFVGLMIAVDSLSDLAGLQISALSTLCFLMTLMAGFGFASARYGDRFWESIMWRWLSWP